MIALRIEEQKKFTSGLFIGELFDQFLLREADIVTFNRFTIDGRVRRGYYTGEEQEEGKIGEFSSWRTIKPVCFSLIRGKRLPETFRIVLCLSEEAQEPGSYRPMLRGSCRSRQAAFISTSSMKTRK